MAERWEVEEVEPEVTVPHRDLPGCIGISHQTARTYLFGSEAGALAFAVALPADRDITVTYVFGDGADTIWTRAPA